MGYARATADRRRAARAATESTSPASVTATPQPARLNDGPAPRRDCRTHEPAVHRGSPTAATS
jgi:hypothetical protein